METQDNVKEMVKQKYSEIALQDKDTNATSNIKFLVSIKHCLSGMLNN
jgi:hypothetical protein